MLLLLPRDMLLPRARAHAAVDAAMEVAMLMPRLLRATLSRYFRLFIHIGVRHAATRRRHAADISRHMPPLLLPRAIFGFTATRAIMILHTLIK